MDRARLMVDTAHEVAAMARRLYDQGEDETDAVPAALENLASVLQQINEGVFDGGDS